MMAVMMVGLMEFAQEVNMPRISLYTIPSSLIKIKIKTY
jgi:hypothetical protein